MAALESELSAARAQLDEVAAQKVARACRYLCSPGEQSGIGKQRPTRRATFTLFAYHLERRACCHGIQRKVGPRWRWREDKLGQQAWAANTERGPALSARCQRSTTRERRRSRGA